MFWLLPVMALDMVDEAVVNAKVVRMLPVYSNTMTCCWFVAGFRIRI